MYSNIQCRFWKYTVFKHTVWIFKGKHCIQSYSAILRGYTAFSHLVWTFERIHYILSYSAILRGCTTFCHTVWTFERIHYIRSYSADFWEDALYSVIQCGLLKGYTIFGYIVRILGIYCIRSYSMSFKNLLYSDV